MSIAASAPATWADETVTRSVPPGGSLSLDQPGTAPTDGNLVILTVRSLQDTCGASCGGPPADTTVTITKRTTPTEEAPFFVPARVVVGPQYDVTADRPVQLAFDVDASALTAGYYMGDYAEQIAVSHLMHPGGNVPDATATMLPDGDMRYTGKPQVTSSASGTNTTHVLSKIPVGVMFPTGSGQKLAITRTKGLKFVNSYCTYICTYTITASISQKSMRLLRLKSTIIASGKYVQGLEDRRRFGQCPGCGFMKLKPGVKAALKDVPEKIKTIPFGLKISALTGPPGTKPVQIPPHGSAGYRKAMLKPFPFSFVVND
jgi:hypothetical protein